MVPVIGMGTWRTFDVRGARAEQVAHEIAIEALEAGSDFFDSSPMYGEAERVLGDALRPRRDEAIIATKVWSPSVAEGKRQIADSLDYFGGRVEVYQVHNLVGWKEYLQILEEMKARGQTRVVGITHYAHSAFPEMRQIMEMGRVDSIQFPYNAADRAVERELLPLAQELDIGVIVMRPLGQGDLARRAPPDDKWQHLKPFGVSTWAQVLLKWVVSDPRVHVAIPATSRPGRMTENAAAGSLPFFGAEQREEIARLAVQYR